jgi:transcriptional regulator
MRENSFATVVTTAGGAPLASPVPVVVDRGPAAIAIRGHVARPNPLWRALEGGAPVLAIFHGPHGYVSPSWYETPPRISGACANGSRPAPIRRRAASRAG